MKLYDAVIRETEELLSSRDARRYPYDPAKAWPETQNSELVLLRDAAYELGGSGLPAVCCTCVTTDPALVPDDSVELFGPELCELSGDAPYARLVFLRVEEMGDDDAAYRAIRELEFVKYNVFPEGFMIRTSPENHREQVRVSRAALASGLSLERVGDAFLRRYKDNPLVKAARVVFVTEPNDGFAVMRENAVRTQKITSALNHVLDDLNVDCRACNMKEICDEVEGMRALHLKKAAAKG